MNNPIFSIPRIGGLLIFHFVLLSSVTANEINWIQRLPNGNLMLDFKKINLSETNFELKATSVDNSNKTFSINFLESENRDTSNSYFPRLSVYGETVDEKKIEIDFGPSTRGWYDLELQTSDDQFLNLKKRLLIGFNLPPSVSHYQQEEKQGPFNSFKISINDTDGFEDISKVFLVISESPEVPEGPVVGIDLDQHLFFEGEYSNSEFIRIHQNFELLDISLSDYESFSSIVRFNPRLAFDEYTDRNLYTWVGYEERFTGTSTYLKGQHEVNKLERPAILKIVSYPFPEKGFFETSIRVSLPELKDTLSSVRLKLFDNHGGVYQLLYNFQAKKGRFVSNDGYTKEDNFESKIEYFEKILDDYNLDLKVRIPLIKYPFISRAQIQAVSTEGLKSDLVWSGPISSESYVSPQYEPVIGPLSDYVSKADTLYPNRKMFGNSDIALMRAYAPLSQPAFMTADEFHERFSHELYTPYPYKHYPIDYDIWNYSKSVPEQSQLIPSVSFTIDTNTLNLSAFPVEPTDDLRDIAALDFNLEPKVIPPWMRRFSRFRELLSAVRKPYIRRLYTGLDYALSLNANSIQLDGFPNGGMMVTLGGDFSPESMEGFAQWLDQNLTKDERLQYGLPIDLNGFNYLHWLKNTKGIKTKNEYMEKLESIKTTNLFREFHWSVALDTYHKIRKHLDLRRPKKHIPITSNGAPDWFAPSAFAYNSSVVDALCAEVHFYPRSELKSVNSIYAYKMANALKVQLVSTPKGEENDFFAENPSFAEGIMPAYIAESYAMGHRIMVPWAFWRKSMDERLYLNPEKFKPIFNFIHENEALIDNFNQVTTTAVVVRYGTMQAKTERIISELINNDVPFTIFLADDKYYPRHLDKISLEAVQRIILVDPINWYNEKDQSILMKFQNKIDYDRYLSPARTPDQSVISVPWGTSKTNEHLIHLLNRNFNTSSNKIEPREGVKIEINKHYIGYQNPKDLNVYLLRPSMPSMKLDIKDSGDSFVTHVPSIDAWGLLYLGQGEM